MPTKTAEPYDFLAEMYDDVMEHVNYVQWASYIKTLLSSEEHEANNSDGGNEMNDRRN